MGSLGEDGGGQVCDGVLEHLYCCGAATEVLKFGQRELGPPGGQRGSPPLLFLIIPGRLSPDLHVTGAALLSLTKSRVHPREMSHLDMWAT